MDPNELAFLLYPLRPEHFGIMGYCYALKFPEDSSTLLYTMLSSLPEYAENLSIVAIQDVIMKVKMWAPDLLPTRDPDSQRCYVRECILPKVEECEICHGSLQLDAEPKRANALTFDSGEVAVTYKEAHCNVCHFVYADCWRWKPADRENRRLSAMRVVSNPQEREFFMILQEPQKSSSGTSIAFIDKKMLELCSNVIVYLRGNFDGIANVWQGLFRRGAPPLHECSWRKKLFPAWLAWRSICILWSKHETEVKNVDFTLDCKHNYEDVYETWGALTPLLRRRHLEEYAREHTCQVCTSVRSVGFDNKCGFTTEVCAFLHGGSREYSIGVKREFGCENAHVVGRRFCACHSQYEERKTGSLRAVCLQGHSMHKSALVDTYIHTCDNQECGSSIFPGTWYYRCDHACDFDLCEVCYANASTPASRRPASSTSLMGAPNERSCLPTALDTTETLLDSSSEGSDDGAALAACPQGHPLHASVLMDIYIHSCDNCDCDSQILPGTWHYRCDHGCDFDLCELCYEKTVLPEPSELGSSSVLAAGATDPVCPPTLLDSPEVLGEDATDGSDDLENPCGIGKPALKARVRRYGGLITAILACGVIALAELSGGCESFTQIYGMAGDIRKYRDYKYIIYDNACVLQRYIRNKTRTLQTSLAQMLATIICVLDRFHKLNHTACLDPEHPGYLPSVDIGRYPELAEAHTGLNESWNSWIDGFAPVVQKMHPRTLGLYTFLLIDLWNVRRIDQIKYRDGSVQLPIPAPKRKLKRPLSRGT